MSVCLRAGGGDVGGVTSSDTDSDVSMLHFQIIDFGWLFEKVKTKRAKGKGQRVSAQTAAERGSFEKA